MHDTKGTIKGVIKQNIKEWAKRDGLTTAYQLWKKSGLNRDTVYKLWNDETAVPRESVMIRLYEVFGWQPSSYLFAVMVEDD